MRWLAIVFALVILGLQYPMWLGKGGWFRVRELNAQVAGQRQTNAELKARNDALDAEVRDLKQGVEAVEERARSELGMIRQDEVFFQLPGEASPSSTASSQPPAFAGAGSRGPSDVQNKDAGFPLTRE